MREGALASNRDDISCPEGRQMLRHDRLFESQLLLQRLNGARSAYEAFEDADPGGMREGAEELGFEQLQRPRGQRSGAAARR